jgi:hypothetical protein
MVGAVNCTDSSTTIFDTDCVFPICLGAKVSSIVVSGHNNDSTITQNAGTLQMIANVLPADAENKNVTWEVSNSAIATISNTGLLSAVANGTVIVKAISKDGSGIEGVKSITITGQSNSLSTQEIVGLQCFPNPVERTLFLDSPLAIDFYTLCTLQGAIIKSGKLALPQIDFSELPAGVYFLDLKFKEQTFRRKVVKN